MTLRRPDLTRGQRLAVETVILVVAAVFLAVLLRGFVAEAFRIPSASMEPQLDIGDRVIVSRTAYKLHDPRRGDVIVFDCPTCPSPGKTNIVVRGIHTIEEAVLLREPQPEEYIKRVIGLPGDKVEGKNGIVYVNDKPLEEPYLPIGTRTSDFAATVVAPDRLWVMGDNRGNSSDSRVFGTIDQETIVGRAILRVWPPWRTAFL